MIEAHASRYDVIDIDRNKIKYTAYHRVIIKKGTRKLQK